MTILDHLCGAADTLDSNAHAHGLPHTTRDNMRTLRIAADSLYDAAERISQGEPIDAPEVAFALSMAVTGIL
ncbi:hypothetical protein [Phaeovulum sp.]|uniref:hypothetical protein n=1 Tax=Phaeovulum sp. TaxID=2934796 RepID=UPI0039E2D955